MAYKMADVENKKNKEQLYCSMCDYRCSYISEYNRHLLTTKHKKQIMADVENKKIKGSVAEYKCECGKSYMQRQGLFKHKKKCKYLEKEEEKVEEKNDNDPSYKELLLQAMKAIEKKDEQINKMIPLIGNNNNTTSISK